MMEPREILKASEALSNGSTESMQRAACTECGSHYAYSFFEPKDGGKNTFTINCDCHTFRLYGVRKRPLCVDLYGSNYDFRVDKKLIA